MQRVHMLANLRAEKARAVLRNTAADLGIACGMAGYSYSERIWTRLPNLASLAI